MACRDFERMIGDAFRRRGFHVAGFGIHAASDGADLALLKSGERFLAQCRHWRKQEIGVPTIRELNTALEVVGAQGGYVLTAGGFTREACEFARSTRIELVGGDGLIAWLRGAERRERGTRRARKPASAAARSAFGGQPSSQVAVKG